MNKRKIPIDLSCGLDLRRRLRESLPDRLYNTIEGTTDSEHAFAVFLNLLGDPELPRSASELARR